VHETATTHPAYAQIGAWRHSGNATLYDSDFRHQHYMVVRIMGSKLMRTGSRDWHYPENVPMVEVAMSESQWATFVSSPNGGSGVPCTLQSLLGKEVAGLPPPAPRQGQFAAEVGARLARAVALLDEAAAAVEASGLSGPKRAPIAGKLRAARSEMGANLDFVAEQFAEHMEDVVERAKAEVHGYMAGALQRAGLEALGGGAPLAIVGGGEGGGGEGASDGAG
jgi:hypothetical protein